MKASSFALGNPQRVIKRNALPLRGSNSDLHADSARAGPCFDEPGGIVCGAIIDDHNFCIERPGGRECCGNGILDKG